MDSIEDPNALENNRRTDVKRTQFEYRKVQSILGDVSFSVVLPKSYAAHLGIGKGDFVKVYQQKNRIIIEKAQ